MRSNFLMMMIIFIVPVRMVISVIGGWLVMSICGVLCVMAGVYQFLPLTRQKILLPLDHRMG